ncbi:hypothetical protein CO037_01660 [Candidatus Pacearchaeota archaeon CG_4_9_14_0_2_um_filter_30_8]|nr:MAG: hypothetical protein CO037_01660 [Candidatus Pacearchaeota archaeon CG_4_9_14_0_2_um_filter_30_8]
MSTRKINGYLFEEKSGSAEFLPIIVNKGDIILYNLPHVDELVLKIEKGRSKPLLKNKLTLVNKFGELKEVQNYDSKLKYFKLTEILTDKSKKYKIFDKVKTPEDWANFVFKEEN